MFGFELLLYEIKTKGAMRMSFLTNLTKELSATLK